MYIKAINHISNTILATVTFGSVELINVYILHVFPLNVYYEFNTIKANVTLTVFII